VSALFCVLDLEYLIKNIIAISVLTQSLPEVIGLMVMRAQRPDIVMPFRMGLYPWPVVVALVGWLFILLFNDAVVILIGVGVELVGAGVYLWNARIRGAWPFWRPHATSSAT
jgi:hypothetical protein